MYVGGGGGERAMASRCACFTNSAVFWKILCSSLHLTFHPFALYYTYCIYYCLFVYMLYPIRDVAFGINELNCIYWTVRMASNRYPLCEYQKFRTRNILDYISNKHIYCMRDINYKCETQKNFPIPLYLTIYSALFSIPLTTASVV